LICQNRTVAARPYYTLLAVKDRDAAKQLLSVFREYQDDRQPYVTCFSQAEEICFLFEYCPERSLSAFSEGQITSQAVRERICVNIVLACLTSPLPYPLLYILLRQRHLHIEKDNTVYFTPYFDLSELQPQIGESACAAECVQILLEILQKRAGQPLKSYDLLRKKINTRSYQEFTELYRDIRITSLPEKNPKLFKRIRAFFARNKDTLFKALLVLSIAAAAIALVMLLSYLIFGNFPLFKLFTGSINEIGTEKINIK
jgi:hypothetical protein